MFGPKANRTCPDKTVARTAVTCGFYDQSHFVKTFRQYVGIAPIDYK
ncbi:AraC family transcriptional regulator [Desulfobacula sp.]